MIRRLQYKFIIYTTLTVSIIITVLLMLLNQIFSRNSLGEVYHVLHYVVEENGKLTRTRFIVSVLFFGEKTLNSIA